MNISLTPDLDQFVAEKVNTGRYTSPSEVIREALGLMVSRDQQLHALNGEMIRRIEGLERGERLSQEQLKQNMESFTDKRRRAK